MNKRDHDQKQAVIEEIKLIPPVTRRQAVTDREGTHPANNRHAVVIDRDGAVPPSNRPAVVTNEVKLSTSITGGIRHES